ncbi:MAG: GNAT family N-acetyltransferase [Chloroflexota bacterium]
MLQIRRYRAEDHDEVWNLHNAALWKVGAHAGNGSWDDDLHRIEEVYLDNGGEFLVGLLDGRVIAMGAIKRSSPERAEVKRMRVHPDHQRKGLGQQILSALQARAIELGYTTLHLDTAVIQTAAQQLYLKNGFHETGRTVLAGFDAILFEKTIAQA